MPYFNIVAETSENTVVTEYEPVKARSESYQSEAALEKEFIRLLCEQGYEYLPIHTEADLVANLRTQLEKLNAYRFTDAEWERFFKNSVSNQNEGIIEKTRRIQEDNVQVLKRDDGTSKNITLIDKRNVHANFLQVINQYAVGAEEGARHDNRYDVTVLVNGLPLVHIELKRRGVPIREAFNQIDRYQRDSFWAGCGLFEYVQIFVISNGTNTKYYSNSTRFNAIRDASSGSAKKEKTSNSFEFTSFWADAKNHVIPDLIDFARTFFARHTILNLLTKYCVFTSENMLMVMRPYQITATERILNRIEIANNYKKYGTVAGGGYIWHTTGSGKTLTSFKTARLASLLPYIDKVLFVVDRKDLDYQTMKEYDRFEKGAANSNTSTAILKRQLEDPNAHIIITTIQKLAMDIIPSDLATYGTEAKKLLQDLQSRNERMFLVTFLILNTADTKQQLDNNVFQASSIAQKYNCALTRLDYRQEEGLMSSLPMGLNEIEIQRGLTTSSTAIFVPFTTQELFQTGREALYCGLNALSKRVFCCISVQ